MKKYIVLILSVFTLTACGPTEQEKVMEEGLQVYYQGDVEKTYEILSKAQKMGPLSDKANEALLDVKTQMYVYYVETGHEERKNKNYEEALKYYDTANEMLSYGEKAPDLVEARETTKSLIEKQKSFDEYVSFFTKSMQESNGLLNKFNEEFKNLQLGNVNPKTFNRHAKEIIDSSNNLVNEVDSLLFVSSDDEELLKIQKDLMNVTRNQQDLFVSSLKVEDLEEDEALLRDINSGYGKIKDDQRVLSNALQNYAKENLLKINDSTKKEKTKKDSEEK